MRPDVPETGWELVAQRDEAAALFRDLVDLGALERADDGDGEATFVLDPDSDVVQAACRFDEVVAAQLDAVEID